MVQLTAGSALVEITENVAAHLKDNSYYFQFGQIDDTTLKAQRTFKCARGRVQSADFE